MRNRILTLGLTLFSILVQGQTIKDLKLTFSPKDFEMVKDNTGKKIVTSSKYPCVYLPDAANPSLPYIGINVLIAPNRDYSSHILTSDENLIEEEVIKQSIMPVSETSNYFQNNQDIYFTDSNQPVLYSGRHVAGGYKILSFIVCPFRYDETRHQLFLKERVDLKISLKSCEVQKKPNPHLAESIRRATINGDELDALYGSYFSASRKSLQSGTLDYNYLIITCDSLKDELQRLADWKTTKGVKAKVETVEHIDSTVTGSSGQIRIKKKIKEYYENSNGELQYVLLAGRASTPDAIVPTQYCYVKVGQYIANLPSDYYYACLEDIEWDTNNNGKIGELEDNISIMPDIIVTRVSVLDLMSAKSVVDKIIRYESCPNTNGWEDNILMCGVKLSEIYDYNGEIKSDSHYKSERMYETYIQPNWDGVKYRFYDTGTDFNGDASYDVTREHIQNQLEQGYTFMYMSTHGGSTLWTTETSSWYYYTDARELVNPKSTIIITGSCSTNNFDYPHCLSECFINNPNSGIVAYYGSTNYNFFVSEQYAENYSDEINGKMFEYLFVSSSKGLGRAVFDSKLYYAPLCTYYMTAYRWLLFSENMLGDPEMPVYLSTPLRFENVNVLKNNNTLSINTGISNCKICVTSYNDFGETFFNVADSVISNSITTPSGTYRICITKQGYIPYVCVIGDDVYVQNEVFNGTTKISAGNVYIGNAVTPERVQGPVAVESGKTSISHTGEVVIEDNFEVKAGAVLEIVN